MGLKKFGRTVLAKENRPYVLAELGGIAGAMVGYAAAAPTTVFLLEQGFSSVSNALLA